MSDHDHAPDHPSPHPGRSHAPPPHGPTQPRGDRKHFLAVISKEEAERRWREALRPHPLAVETVPLARALGRTLAEDVTAPIDLPPFDRAVVDGFAVVARDTFGADETPARLRLGSTVLAAGDDAAGVEVTPGEAVEVATGAPIPRGANAVVMVEDSHREGDGVLLGKGVTPGEGIQSAGSDVRSGEILFRRGERIGARETSVLAAQGLGEVPCWKRPRVAVISTGDELVEPGKGPLRPGQIFDSNGPMVADLVRENGGEPVALGIGRDDPLELRALLERARECDLVVLSGGTSKGAGDLTYKLVGELGEPGILVHGVSVKPGKPLVLAAWGRKPVAILPGFPTSAAITFDVFVKPVLRVLAGLDPLERRERDDVKLAVSMPGGGGRHELVLCHLVPAAEEGAEPLAFPILKGSGSATAFAQADGFLEVPAGRERAERGERFRLTLLDAERRPRDLTILGSGCPLVDVIVRLVREKRGFRAKLIAQGARLGLEAAGRGEADVVAAPLTGPEALVRGEVLERAGLIVVRGYARRTGLAARGGTLASLGTGRPEELLARARAKGLRLVNRNLGSATRTALDLLIEKAAKLEGGDLRAFRASLPGLDLVARSHEGAVASVRAGNADLVLTIESAARRAGLEFLFVREEPIDFAIPRARSERAPVRAFVEALGSDELAKLIAESVGFSRVEGAGRPVTPPS